MPVRLEWRVGDSDYAVVDAADKPPPKPRPQARKIAGRLLLLLVYAVGLMTAAWLGFYLGRWSDVRAAHRSDIQAALDIEQLAWRDGDTALYEATIMPIAPPAAASRALEQFSSFAPMEVELEIESVRRDGPDGSCVEVRILGLEGSELESREYVLYESTWRRTLEACRQQ